MQHTHGSAHAAEVSVPIRLMVDDRLADDHEPGVALPVASSPTPRLSWVVPLVRNLQQQVAYEIVAARTALELAALTAGEPLEARDAQADGDLDAPFRDSRTEPLGLVWASGRVESAENRAIAWGGTPLAPHSQAWWAVRVTDENGDVSGWSAPAEIVTGPFSAADWNALWITFASTEAAFIDFELGARALDVGTGTPAITRATVHFAGAGRIRPFIDGTAVNPDANDPTDSSLKRSISRSYDVTHLLMATGTTHRFAVAAILSHYRLVLDQPRVIAELRIEFSDDSVQSIGTSPEWQLSRTSLIADDPFYLEEHDNRIADSWAAPGGRPIGDAGRHADPVALFSEAATASVAAILTESAAANDAAAAAGTPAVGTPAPPATTPSSDRTGHSGVIEPDAGPPIRIVRRLNATQIGAPAPDVRVYELAENVSARVSLELHGVTAGVRLEVVHGEKLDANGRVDTTNIRLPNDRERERQVFAYTAKGGDETAEPWFASFGFRYVEVRNIAPDVGATLTAGVLHSAAEQIGTLTSDSPELNSLVEMAARTQYNNTPGYPSDCPTREQGGWTGDASISAEAGLAHIDLTGVYRNWLADVALDAQPDGGIVGVSPNLLGPEGVQPADPVWGSAMTEIPWQTWWATGDASIITELLPAMHRWADWQVNALDDGIVTRADISYGADWLAFEQTPPVLLQTGAVVTSLRQLADLEEAAGAPHEAALRREQADAVVEGARRHLRDDVELTWGNDSQGSNAVAIVTGLAEPADHEFLSDRLRLAVAARGDRLSSGFPGTKAVVEALARADGGTALLAAIRQREQPGIGSMLVDGPGTFWETWWIDNENVGVASLDHIGLGAPYAAWAWRYVAGLRATEPGFRRFTIAPALVGLVNSMSFERLTPRGDIRAQWSYEGGEYCLEVTVPVGAVAEVALPGEVTGAVLVDGAEVATVASAVEGAGLATGSVVAPAEAATRSVLVGGAEAPGGERMLVFGPGIHFVKAAVVLPERHDPAAQPNRRALSGETWLSDGVSSTWLPQSTTAAVRLDEHDIICTPVYHEPLPAPTLTVTLADFRPDVDEWLVLDSGGRTFDLSDAAFAFASFDVDGPGLVGRRVRPMLRLTSADGTVRTAHARPLPIAWNRVALEVGDWPGRSAVIEVAVGIRWSDVHDTGRGPWLPLPEGDGPHWFEFRVGRVGFTSAPRTF
ncbi:family 78 glycoside hydrolase catalytic domain [Subtercola lobariae]|uniref:alpha-L-rhamnosidase n=1 Tax=Subtercola lobariae TaxID=1588641 RepID=A0A917BG82_9MICO|nr:family 78 glycoside hydrolase catalytic domain [Subtercola lobariae]GGF37781.1 hypothetical protein GCM10011399_33420 [Subtercola lobariae]